MKTLAPTKSVPQRFERIMTDHPPMPFGVEKKLRARMKKEPEVVRELLWKHNLRFAVMSANRLFARKPPRIPAALNDLVQTAIVALWEASFSYDFSKGAKFISYAKWNIDRALRDHLRESDVGYSVPRGEAQKRVIAAQLLGTGKKHHLFSDNQMRIALARTMTPAFLDAPISMGEASGEDNLHSLLLDSKASGTVTKNDSHATLDKLLKDFGKKDPRGEKVLRARFGIGGNDPQILAAVGKKWGLTRERVRQIEAHSLKMVRLLAERRRIKFSDLLCPSE